MTIEHKYHIIKSLIESDPMFWISIFRSTTRSKMECVNTITPVPIKYSKWGELRDNMNQRDIVSLLWVPMCREISSINRRNYEKDCPKLTRELFRETDKELRRAVFKTMIYATNGTRDWISRAGLPLTTERMIRREHDGILYELMHDRNRRLSEKRTDMKAYKWILDKS